MILREYKSADCAQLAQLFYETVHTINILDYSPEQMDAWAHKEIDLPKWDASFRAHKRIVAIDKKIVGFGDIDKSKKILNDFSSKSLVFNKKSLLSPILKADKTVINFQTIISSSLYLLIASIF